MYVAPELWLGVQPNFGSDVYALGVLLFQLVVGSLSRRPDTGWERLIDDPLLGEDVARATEGDAAERFGSVAELTRALRQLPQRRAARDAGRRAALEAERLRADAARARLRRPYVVLAFALFSVALASLAGLSWQARTRNVEMAEHRRTLEGLNRFLDEDLIGSADPRVGGRLGLTVVDAAVRAEQLVDTKYAAEPPAVRALIHADLQRTLYRLTRFEESLAAGRNALRLESALSPAEAMESHIWMSGAYGELGRLPLADKEIGLADGYRTAAHLEQTRVGMLYWEYKSFVQGDAYRLADARASIGRAREIAAVAPGVSVAERETIEFQVADAERMLGHAAAAEAILVPLLQQQERRLQARHPLPCMTKVALAMVQGYQGRPQDGVPLAADALSCLQATLGPGDDHAFAAMDTLAGLHFQSDDWRNAEQVWTEELRGREPALGDQNFKILTIRINIARCQSHLGDFAAAEGTLRPALVSARKAYRDDDPIVQGLRFGLLDALLDQRKTEGVAALLQGLDAKALATQMIANDWDARLRLQQGRLLLLQGDFARALEALQEAQRVMRARGGDDRFPDAVVQRYIDEARAGRRQA
jgi:non-specific serine/threonine protein kinase